MTDDLFQKCRELSAHLERLYEAYCCLQLEQLMEGDYVDVDETNRRLSEMVEVVTQLAMAKRDWVALMPIEYLLRAEALMSNQAEEEFKRWQELLEEMDVLDDFIANLEAPGEARVN